MHPDRDPHPCTLHVACILTRTPTPVPCTPYPRRLVLWVGSLLLFLGYGCVYLQAAATVEPVFLIVLLCAFVGGNSGTWHDTSIVVGGLH